MVYLKYNTKTDYPITNVFKLITLYSLTEYCTDWKISLLICDTKMDKKNKFTYLL